MANYARNLIIFDDSHFHVTWKCHNEDWLLHSQFAKKLYYSLLLKYKKIYGVKFYSYCFMANHPHMTGHCESQELFSDFFKVVNSCFAKRINKHLKRRGQAVMDRFKSPTMKTDEDVLSVIIYNDLNPARTSKKIHPKDFKWSSYHHYANGEVDPLIDEPACYTEIGNTPKARQRVYRKMIDEIFKTDPKIQKCMYRDSKKRLILFVGDPKWVAQRYNALKRHTQLKRALWMEKYKIRFGIETNSF